MRRWLILAGLLAGCDAKPDSSAPLAAPVAKALAAGDVAPPLTVTQWLHGSPVEMKPGTAYVVQFWAVWNAECLALLPRLDRLARDYGPQEVEIVVVTTKDSEGNDLAHVEQFVRDTGKKYQVHLAWCENDTTHRAWYSAANQSGFPCFVVDKAGKVAFIGSPDWLEDVVPVVAAGKWRGTADLEAIESMTQRLERIVQKAREAAPGDKVQAAKKALEEIETFTKEFPLRGARDDVRSRQMALQMTAGDFDAAKLTADKLLAHYKLNGDFEMVTVIWARWLNPATNPERKHLTVAVAAGELLLVQCGENDLKAVLASAEAHSAAGNVKQFDDLAARARRLTENDPDRRAKVEAALKSFEKK